MLPIKALGEHIILTAKAESAGTEQTTESGIFTGYRQQGEIPDLCTIYAIGSDVPPGYVEVGDLTPLPSGGIAKNVMHPEVAAGLKKAKDIPEKFITVHYKALACVYK